MANTDAPFGAMPIKHLDGSPYNGATREYKIADAYNTAIYFGDFVKAEAAGVIQVAAAGNTILGVFQGCRYRNAAGEQVYSKHWPASTATFGSEGAIATVVDAPDVVFAIQNDSDSATPAQADVFANADFVSTHTGSSLTGMSKMELDTSTFTTGTANLCVIGFVEAADNTIGNFARVEVLINEHFHKTTAGA